MKETTGNLFLQEAEVMVITTNGFVKNNGECVMGRGCAREARDENPGLALHLGDLITEFGNRAFNLGIWKGQRIVSMPVKDRWMDDADVELIAKSAHELVTMADKFGWKSIVLPRPGCGNGNLRWDQVQPWLSEILDDRFTAITFR